MTKDIHAHLNNETVAELEPHAGLRVSPLTPVGETIKLMQENRTGCALVCEGSKLVGIFTEQDYVRRVLGQHLSPDTPMSACMSRNPARVRSSESVATLVGRFHLGRLRRLPVVDEQDRVVGCVSVQIGRAHV